MTGALPRDYRLLFISSVRKNDYDDVLAVFIKIIKSREKLKYITMVLLAEKV